MHTNFDLLLSEEPTTDCAAIPAPLRALATELTEGGNSSRTGLALLGPAAYEQGRQWASPCLRLRPVHLGREVLAWCEAQGTGRVLLDGMGLLGHVLRVHYADPPRTVGTWLWGLDVLLAKLTPDQRTTFWAELWHWRQRPPLLVVLPAELAAAFGPDDVDTRWGAARPPRGVRVV